KITKLAHTVLCYAPPVSESQERPRGRRFAIADREAILGDRRISGRARMVAALCGNLRSPAREKLELHCGWRVQTPPSMRRHLRAWAYGNDGTSGDAGGNIGTGRCSPQLRPAGRAAATAEVGGFSRRK